MILFYKDYFFPVGHIDEGKPVPLGLCGQLGSRPHHLSKEWLKYKSLMLELDFKGYSSSVRNGDDPIQEHLRGMNYKEVDFRNFEELCRVGVARIGVKSHSNFDPLQRFTVCLNKTIDLLTTINHVEEECAQVRNAALVVRDGARLLLGRRI